MARTNTRLITSYNAMIEFCGTLKKGQNLPSENILAEQLDVSRTLVRAVLSRLRDAGIVQWEGREKHLLRKPRKADRLDMPKQLLGIADLEDQFFDWVLRLDVPPGTTMNVRQIAREFSVAPHTLQEFLSSLSRFGIVERLPRGGWMLVGFTPDFAIELSDFRAVLELNAVSTLVTLPSDHSVWSDIEALEAEHHDLLDRIDRDYHDFSRLDERFHQTINRVVNNRFIDEFQKLISLIFHYHFQWNKSDERQRNADAIGEHLTTIEALRSRDQGRAVCAARDHLATSKQTLLQSLQEHKRAVYDQDL